MGLKQIRGYVRKKAFSSVSWISQVLFAPSGKGRKRQKNGQKGRFWPISRKGGQTPLKPPFVTPPFAAAQLSFRGNTCQQKDHPSGKPTLLAAPDCGSRGPSSFGVVDAQPLWLVDAKTLTEMWLLSEEVFASQERVSAFPGKGADVRESPGNLPGSSGNFREVWETSGEPLDYC